MKIFLKKSLFLLPIIIFLLGLSGFEDSTSDVIPAPTVFQANKWVDSVFNTLTLEQQVGQLFMAATYSNRNESYYQTVEKLISEHKVGGLIFFQGNPYQQSKLINRYQALSTVPLMIGIDGEWGLGMRLDSVDDFPKQMTLGAITDNRYILEMGREIGRQCRLAGINVNFAPVADINSNPRNPVIGVRSFGEDPVNVAQKCIAYMKGMQQKHIVTTAKHFPGHGDTDTDSHYTLPVLSHSSEYLDENDLFPFRKLIADSLTGIVTGHLYVPVLDNTPLLASSLSKKIVTDLLKKHMGFQGLVFTDAMNMQGVKRGSSTVDINIKALQAGNDILVYAENIAETIRKIKTDIERGIIDKAIIEEKVRKILAAKYWMGLHSFTPVSTELISKNLVTPETRALNRELCERAITLVHDSNQLLPIKTLDTCTFASIAIGGGGINMFQQTLSKYAPFRQLLYADTPTTHEEVESLVKKVAGTKIVIVSLHDNRRGLNRTYPINSFTKELISKLQQKSKVIVSLFASPYSIEALPPTAATICAYENMTDLQIAAAQQIFGGLEFRGKLPVSVEKLYTVGTGINTNYLSRIGFGFPEQAGMQTNALKRIDTLIQNCINAYVFPGCQMAIVKNGRIVYQKNYGTLTYDSPATKVSSETLYDVASITKVAATLQVTMTLYEQGAIQLEDKASKYLPELMGSNKENITIEELLTHRAGLLAFYPVLWERTKIGRSGLMPAYYSSIQDSVYSMQVAPKLYAKPALRDSVWRWIIESPLTTRKSGTKYVFIYSDLGILILQKILERVINQPLDEFLYQNFYEPLGMSMTRFRPLQYFPPSQIAPTENDFTFRNQLIRGTVHDQMGAINGGLAGHAGLFSTATDLAILMQMNLQKGIYGDRRFFKEGTLSLFTQTFDNYHHRGLGWDKAPLDKESNYVASAASEDSYGHSGFTGSMVWIDPKENLVFVLLSNRIHPNAENNQMNRQKIRRRVHELVYQAIAEDNKRVF